MRGLLVALTLGVGCRSLASEPTPASPAAGDVESESPVTKPVLPPGVIAEAEGKHGLVVVEERDGLRLLTIDGVVHGAVTTTSPNPAVAADPLIALVEAARPRAKTALLIGLGTGQTAMAMGQAGLDVTVVEREPAVVEFAREHFGFEGEVLVAEGAEHLQHDTTNYDVVVLDVPDPNRPGRERPPGEMIYRAVLRVPPGGVLAVRMYGRPSDVERSWLWSRYGRLYTHVYVSGVGDEPQNLYVLHSKKAVNIVKQDGLPAWPLPLLGSSPGVVRTLDVEGPGRDVRIAGYVIVERESGAVALDLPHAEMGAQRYLLTGVGVEALREALGSTNIFPTAGDIRSDGDLGGTARQLLGGGGWKRSDVRFSPVVAVVQGRATVVSVVHPDGAMRGPQSMRGVQQDPRLPYGGTLYELAVDRVLGTITARDWRALRTGPLAKYRRLATRAAKKGQARKFLKALTAYRLEMDRGLGPLAQMLPVHAEVTRLQQVLDAHLELAGDMSRWCAKMAAVSPGEFEAVNPDVATWHEAFARCAGKDTE